MPRMSASAKEESHDRILTAAARLFRERGIEATSVADIMKAAGLTHGGFYRHFDSKQALVTAAFRRAVEELLSEAEAAPDREEAQARFLARYLSSEHVGDPGHGCPLIALGAEIARDDGPAQTEASSAMERMAALLATGEQDDVDPGLAMMALLLGAVSLARIAKSPELSAKMRAVGERGVDVLKSHWRD
ncbi:TetR/AcrR family transcriptional regulator [Roseibium aggregatum]|uniref:TetR/AcrR family transcriptional regulator n=1 Tax=Roseibium aggregatum TaxID=187304 RepID=A0A926P4Y3_9HYPH|nr:TetR/AcrR family transcriptional regulator [Roseibium aggregatum]MBD1549643.1 TetR/AcrR family transcriptional regulator [Roseibium aggregatum]